MIKKITCFFVIIYFLGSCAREVNSQAALCSPDSVALDESTIVITHEPYSLKYISDSIIGFINAGQDVSLYDVKTGKNIRNFTTQHFNFDSLTNATFQKHYSGKRSYHYDPLTAGGLSNGNSQILDFTYTDSKYYIYVNTTVDVNYDQDTVQLKKYENDPQLKAIRKETTEYNLIVQEYLEYIFVTNDQFQLLEVVPLYENEILKKDGYSPLYPRGFTVHNNVISFPVIRDELITKGMNAGVEVCGNCYALAEVPFREPGQLEYRLNFSNMNIKKYTVHDFLSCYFCFKTDETRTLFSNAKGVYDIHTEKPILADQTLKTNEWIADFSCSKKGVLLATYMTYKKSHPSDIDIAYGVDSISNFRVRLIDPESGHDLLEKKLAPSGLFPVTLNNDKIFLIVKDKVHYYIKSFCFRES